MPVDSEGTLTAGVMAQRLATDNNMPVLVVLRDGRELLYSAEGKCLKRGETKIPGIPSW